MDRNFDLERAVGMIAYHLHRGDDDETAIAKVTERIPQLTPRQIAFAWQWAQAACHVARAFVAGGSKQTLAELLDECGVPWRECQ